MAFQRGYPRRRRPRRWAWEPLGHPQGPHLVCKKCRYVAKRRPTGVVSVCKQGHRLQTAYGVPPKSCDDHKAWKTFAD